MKSILRAAQKYGLHYLRYTLLFVALSAAASVLEMFVTQVTGSIGQAAVSMEASQITSYLWIMAALTGAKALFSTLSVYLKGRFSGRVDYKLREGFAGHLLSIPFSALDKKNAGAMLSLFTGDLARATALIAAEIFDLLAGIATLVVCAVFMARLHPLYTLIFFVMYPPLVLMQAAISKPVMVHAHTASEKRAAYNAIVNDSLQNTSTIVAYGLENTVEQRYQNSFAQYFEALKKRMRVFVILIISGIVGTLLPELFACAACALSVARGTMSVGTFLVYVTLAGTANGWLTMLSQRLGDIRADQAGLIRLEESLSDEVPPQVAHTPALEARHGAPAIAFDGVRFSYGEDAEALSGVNLMVQPGERVAVVGPSGSGKSTVLKLVLALYDAQEGQVRLFGSAQNAQSSEQLRVLLSYVPQDSFLLSASIRENITCAAEEEAVDEERLLAAARDAGILDFVLSLPGGFDAVLAEDGENLSGGQRQRIAIARAFYRNAPILLLDEATAALDPITEKAILRTVFQAARERAVLLVTHRLEATRECERIYVLVDGKVAEQGGFDELLRANGAFAALYSKQQKEGPNESKGE